MVESFFSSSVARMTPKKTMHVITNPWFALMAKYHVSALLSAATASAGQRKAVKKHKAGLTISMGERRGAEGDCTPALGAGTGNSAAQQRHYGSSKPPENPLAKDQAGTQRGSAQRAVAGGKQVSPHHTAARAWPVGTVQSHMICNTSVLARSPIFVLAASYNQTLPQITSPS